MKTPDLTAKVLGYRRFRLVQSAVSKNRPLGTALLPTAMSQHYTWVAGVNTAQCLWNPKTHRYIAAHAEPAPQEQCTCGLYAYHAPIYYRSHEVIGAILAWGNIAVHRDGFRAQYAEIVGLYWPYADQYAEAHADRIRDRYKVPLVSTQPELVQIGWSRGRPIDASLIATAVGEAQQREAARVVPRGWSGVHG